MSFPKGDFSHEASGNGTHLDWPFFELCLPASTPPWRSRAWVFAAAYEKVCMRV